MSTQTSEDVVYSVEAGWTPRPTEVFGELSAECREIGESLGFEYSPDGLWYRTTTPAAAFVAATGATTLG